MPKRRGWGWGTFWAAIVAYDDARLEAWIRRPDFWDSMRRQEREIAACAARMAVSSSLDERTRTKYAALVQKETDHPIDHPSFVILCSPALAEAAKHDVAAPDMARRLVTVLRAQQAARKELRDCSAPNSRTSWRSLPRPFPEDRRHADAEAHPGLYVDTLLDAYEAMTDRMVAQLAGLAARATPPGHRGPTADRALGAAFMDAVAFLKKHHPTCRRRREVAVALLRFHGWDVGAPARLPVLVERLAKKAKRTRSS